MVGQRYRRNRQFDTNSDLQQSGKSPGGNKDESIYIKDALRATGRDYGGAAVLNSETGGGSLMSRNKQF